jgi:hypothetical protein
MRAWYRRQADGRFGATSRVIAGICLAGVLCLVPSSRHPGLAKASGRRERPGRLVPAYGADGRLPADGDHLSPDRRYLVRGRYGMGEVLIVSVIDRRTHRRLTGAYGVSDFMWVPGSPHRLVAPTCGVYGKASFRMWEGGKRWRRLLPVRHPDSECFVLYGATVDGRLIVYGHDPNLSVLHQHGEGPLKRKRWLRLPP